MADPKASTRLPNTRNVTHWRVVVTCPLVAGDPPVTLPLVVREFTAQGTNDIRITHGLVT